MKRDFLSGLGLEKDIVDKIMEENGKDIEQAKVKYSDYDTLKEQASKFGELQKALEKSGSELAEKDKTIGALNEKIQGYECENLKVRLALENGLPYSSVQFLKGTTEEDIKKSVEGLKELMGDKKNPPPLALNGEGNNKNGGTSKDEALKEMLNNLLQKG